jgi:hypothetical protein
MFSTKHIAVILYLWLYSKRGQFYVSKRKLLRRVCVTLMLCRRRRRQMCLNFLNSVQQCSLQINSCSADAAFSKTLSFITVQMSPPLYTILCQLNPVHLLTFCLFKFNFDIIHCYLYVSQRISSVLLFKRNFYSIFIYSVSPVLPYL